MKRPWILAIPFLFMACDRNNSGEEVVSQKYIHKYGFELDEKEWIARDRDGKIEQYLENGVKVAKTYENGYLHGETTYSYPYSATVEKSYMYEEGELVQETFHDRSGVPIQQKTYDSEDEKTITFWNVSGSPLRIERYERGLLVDGTYYSPQNTIESEVQEGEGIRYKRSRTGVLLGIDHISQGELQKRTTFYPNGQTHVVSEFSDYLLNGKQEIYTASGRLYMSKDWEDGFMHGKKIAYKNDQVVMETPYEYGKKDGVEKRFDPQGNLLAEIRYQDDEKHGLTIRYSDKDLAKEEWFFHGKATSHERFQALMHKEEALQIHE